jgi:hypothetical protein
VLKQRGDLHRRPYRTLGLSRVALEHRRHRPWPWPRGPRRGAEEVLLEGLAAHRPAAVTRHCIDHGDWVVDHDLAQNVSRRLLFAEREQKVVRLHERPTEHSRLIL